MYALHRYILEHQVSRLPVSAHLFCSKHQPAISVKKYLKRLCVYMSPAVVIATIAYLHRLRDSIPLNSLTTHRTVLVALGLSAEYWEDHFMHVVWQKAFARRGGISYEEFSRLKLEMFRLLNYQLHLTATERNFIHAKLTQDPGSTSRVRDSTSTGLGLEDSQSDQPSTKTHRPASPSFSSTKRVCSDQCGTTGD